MKKISIISACTDLGLKIDGAELGAQALTEGLKPSNISQNYILKGSKKSEESHSNSDSNDINSFVSKFDDLLLEMHEIHFEENMNNAEKDAYYTKMHNLVLLAEGVGGASELSKYIEDKTGIETRATVLGHIQRGGSPVPEDRILASKMAEEAICLLEKRDILIPRIMLSINISLYILKNYCFFHYLAEELLSVADVSLTRPSGWSETFNSLVLSS